MVDEYSSVIGEVANGGTTCLAKSDRENIMQLLRDIQGLGSSQLKADIDLVMEEMASGPTEELFGIAFEN